VEGIVCPGGGVREDQVWHSQPRAPMTNYLT